MLKFLIGLTVGAAVMTVCSTVIISKTCQIKITRTPGLTLLSIKQL